MNIWRNEDEYIHFGVEEVKSRYWVDETSEQKRPTGQSLKRELVWENFNLRPGELIKSHCKTTWSTLGLIRK